MAHNFTKTTILVAILAAAQVQAAQLGPNQVVNVQESNTADLTLLINETLAINNKTTSAADRGATKDDWTFDMVEYDLMEFLQDLSARYQRANKTADQLDSILDAKKELELAANAENATQAASELTEVRGNSTKLEPAQATQAPEVPRISLASGDHEIAESSWQYGIFDRFTRPKASSTTAAPELPLPLDPEGNLDTRNFNNDECGLRVYEEPESHFYPDQLEQYEASKDLSQRRQRLPPSPAVSVQKHKHNHPSDLLDRNSEDTDQAYDSYRDSFDQYPSGDAAADNEFNLSSRRHWLQQQLGNTLQMLGFNATTQSAAEFLNQTAGFSLNRRENMMKMSGKLGRSLDESKGTSKAGDITEQELIARQDELKLEARVIGGSDARMGDSPWSVSLQALVSRPGTGGVEYRHYCGGTIISEYYVLTAAHCLDFMAGRESRLFVVIGDLNWRMSPASLYGRRFGIEKLIIHSGYKSTAFGHDIGLIKTKESMKPLKVKGRYIINSVCLPERGVEHTGEAELVGWGLFSNRNEMADSLQIADVPILPRPLCVDLYRRRTGLIQWLIGIELITDKQVCAGTFGRGICQGDSGSALVVNEKVSKRQSRQRNKLRNGETQSKATIIGTVAFGGIRRCSYQSLPGVYMQTSKYMDWILPRIQ